MEPATTNTPGHETRDVSVRPIVLISTGVVVASLFFMAAMWLLINLSAIRQAEQSPPSNPLAALAPQEPPQPRLQTHPLLDLRELRQRESDFLNHYSWVDKNTGVVRIPIERAMDLIAERGVRVAPQAASGGASQ